MKMNPINLTILGAAVLGAFSMLPSAKAQYQLVADFSTSEGYPAATAAFTTTTPANNAGANNPFTGNSQGWSTSSSTAAGSLVTPPNISFLNDPSAQALTSTATNPSGSTTVETALNAGLPGITGLQFDLYYNGGNQQVWAAGYFDGGSTGGFIQNNDVGVSGGVMNNGNFGIRQAGSGTSYYSSYTPTVGDWYQITLTYNYLGQNNAGNSATIGIYDLSTAAQIGTFTQAGASLFSANGAWENPATDSGVVVRVSSANMLTCISVQPVPEPGLVALSAIGGLMMLFLRRRSLS
jgi:hypothetical protein